MGGKLRMYNVEFGDAFLLYGEGENLLVDLGSIDSGFCFDLVRDSIRAESAGRQFSLMLTHFHRDHWSGLHDQPAGHPLPPIQIIYLPDIFGMRYVSRLDVIVRSLLGDFLEAVILQKDPRFTLAELLREVLPGLPRNQIRFLSRGDTFTMGGQSCEVLWPRLTQMDVVGKRNPRLMEFLERADAKLDAVEASGGLWDTMDTMANILLRDFARSIEYPISTLIRAEGRSYEELYGQAQRMAAALAEETARDEGEFRDKVRRYAEKLRQDWNRVSLVFQERSEARKSQTDSGVLMTGDITNTILKRLADGTYGNPRLRDRYDVIKAPHHGTNTHFCAVLPHCRYLCISNGEGNPKFHKIAEEYEHVYGCWGKKAEMCCTNQRCEFFDLRGICPYFSTHAEADYYDVCW